MMKGLTNLMNTPWYQGIDAETYQRMMLRLILLALFIVGLFVGAGLAFSIFVMPNISLPGLLHSQWMMTGLNTLISLAVLCVIGVFVMLVSLSVKLFWLRGKNLGYPWLALSILVGMFLFNLNITPKAVEAFHQNAVTVEYSSGLIYLIVLGLITILFTYFIYFKTNSAASSAKVNLLEKSSGRFENILLFIFQIYIWFTAFSVIVFPFVPGNNDYDSAVMSAILADVAGDLPENDSMGTYEAQSDMVLDEGFDLSPTDQPNP